MFNKHHFICTTSVDTWLDVVLTLVSYLIASAKSKSMEWEEEDDIYRIHLFLPLLFLF